MCYIKTQQKRCLSGGLIDIQHTKRILEDCVKRNNLK